jgi:FK506-binding protein 4/5
MAGLESIHTVILANGGVTKEILVEGTGLPPPNGCTVSVHYTGALSNGKQFDSSRDRGTPISFKVGKGAVIRGWDIAMATMKVGERARLTIAPEYGYGLAGSGDKIPGKATLVFDVELLSYHEEHSESENEDGEEKELDGVTKVLVSKGKGWLKANKRATCICDVTTKAGEVVLSTTSDHSYDLSDPLLTDGLVRAIRSMKNGEISNFKVQPDVAYGVQGDLKNGIGPKQEITYAVCLKKIKNPPEHGEYEKPERVRLMTEIKGKGNALFLAGHLERAVDMWNESLEVFSEDCVKSLSPSEATTVNTNAVACHSNIANVQFKQGDFEGAVESCSNALGLQADFVKALYRRGESYLALDNLDLALEDLTIARDLAPNDAVIRKSVAKVKEQLSAQDRLQAKTWAGMFQKVNLTQESKIVTESDS